MTTAPLTPADSDLTDFSWMPLEIQRLRRSKAWLICKRNPALAFYMINLWTASWHDKPAGSLEDDDDVLADLAMCDPTKWQKIKADVLRGWMKADDGRLYHPVVAEKVREAWDSKLDQRWRTERGRIKKHNDRHHTKVAMPTFEEWVSSGCPQGQRLPVPRDINRQGGETPSKGQGEGQEEGEGQGQGYLKENSEAAASGDESPSVLLVDDPPDPRDVVFGLGVPLLTGAGVKDASARSFLALHCKGGREAEVAAALRACAEAKPVQPIPWLAQRLNKAGKHAGFASKNYREGVTEDGSFT